MPQLQLPYQTCTPNAFSSRQYRGKVRIRQYDHPTRILVVVDEVEQDDDLHEDIGRDLGKQQAMRLLVLAKANQWANRADRDTDELLLVAPMGHITSESKHLEPAWFVEQKT
jgi:polysaccharide deacetylase 2 family uncharacterized protein YibQ